VIQVNNPQAAPFDTIPSLAIAVKQLPPPEHQKHTGILYKEEGGSVALLHLKFHHELAKESPSDTYFWVSCSFDLRLQQLFVQWLETIWQRNTGGAIPFSIEYSGKYIDANGNYVRTKMGEGLTCATWVVCVFADYGLPFIDIDTWPKNPSLGDRKWQKKILQQLRAKATPEHVAKQEAIIGKVVRFRPEHVAGAFGLFDGNTQIVYTRAYKAAEKLVEIIRLSR